MNCKQINRVHTPVPCTEISNYHKHLKSSLNFLYKIDHLCATHCTWKVTLLRKTSKILAASLWEYHFSLPIHNYNYLQFITITAISMQFKDTTQ